jgi:hypothetical protein
MSFVDKTLDGWITVWSDDITAYVKQEALGLYTLAIYQIQEGYREPVVFIERGGVIYGYTLNKKQGLITMSNLPALMYDSNISNGLSKITSERFMGYDKYRNAHITQRYGMFCSALHKGVRLAAEEISYGTNEGMYKNIMWLPLCFTRNKDGSVRANSTIAVDVYCTTSASELQDYLNACVPAIGSLWVRAWADNTKSIRKQRTDGETKIRRSITRIGKTDKLKEVEYTGEIIDLERNPLLV